MTNEELNERVSLLLGWTKQLPRWERRTDNCIETSFSDKAPNYCSDLWRTEELLTEMDAVEISKWHDEYTVSVDDGLTKFEHQSLPRAICQAYYHKKQESKHERKTA